MSSNLLSIIPEDCFITGSLKAGTSETETESNIDQLLAENFQPKMKVQEVVVCENTWLDAISTIQLKLADSDGGKLELEMLGFPADAGLNCSSLTLTSNEFVEQITVTNDETYIETISIQLNSERQMSWGVEDSSLNA